MISKRAEPPIVALSVRVYQAFLVAYPTKFQQKYGEEMVQVFQDCCLRAFRQGGANGIVRLWAITLFDLIQSVLSEHAQKEIEMKKEMKPEDIRLTGWALFVGAVTFFLGLLLGREPFNLWGISVILLAFLSFPMLVVGLLGLRNQYGEKVGSFGKNILLIGTIIGPVTSLIGIVGAAVDPFWILIYTGPAVLFVCLALFGVVALYTKPLPRWNALPLIAGLWYPSAFFSSVITSIITGDWVDDSGGLNILNTFLLLLQCLALAALGYILQSDVPEETAIPA